MKLEYIKIIKADTCGGLLDGLEINFRATTHPINDAESSELSATLSAFNPFCLIGPNGSGKSQLLQLLAEAFQLIANRIVPSEERVVCNSGLQFIVEYTIYTKQSPIRVRWDHQVLAQSKSKKPTLKLTVWPPVATETQQGAMQVFHQWMHDSQQNKAKSPIAKQNDGAWFVSLPEKEVEDQYTLLSIFLPHKIVGYTSGDNETLSLPFYTSRSGYAKDVRESALGTNNNKNSKNKKNRTSPEVNDTIPDTRLMQINYDTHLEVLIANLVMGDEQISQFLLTESNLQNIQSFRCIIQLDKGKIKTTDELYASIINLQKCATCYEYNPTEQSWTLDFFIDDATRQAFRAHWKDTLQLYQTFHKLAMLNDLKISKKARDQFEESLTGRHFAAKLPEPEEEDKVFRFEEVKFVNNKNATVDYVALSDGEHQLAQLLGMFSMLSQPNILFLLDEPESHFNPQWRVKFVSKLLETPTAAHGKRGESGLAAWQECLLTTHAPFVPSDMRREQVLIFSKQLAENVSSSNKPKQTSQTSLFADAATSHAESDPPRKIEVRRPNMETYGATFEAILAECFGVKPPLSQLSRRALSDYETQIRALVSTPSPEKEEKLDAIERILLNKFSRSLYRNMVLDLLDRVRDGEIGDNTKGS